MYVEWTSGRAAQALALLASYIVVGFDQRVKIIMHVNH